MNVQYVYSKLKGRRFDGFEKLIFKEGQKPPQDPVVEAR